LRKPKLLTRLLMKPSNVLKKLLREE